MYNSERTEQEERRIEDSTEDEHETGYYAGCWGWLNTLADPYMAIPNSLYHAPDGNPNLGDLHSDFDAHLDEMMSEAPLIDDDAELSGGFTPLKLDVSLIESENEKLSNLESQGDHLEDYVSDGHQSPQSSLVWVIPEPPVDLFFPADFERKNSDWSEMPAILPVLQDRDAFLTRAPLAPKKSDWSQMPAPLPPVAERFNLPSPLPEVVSHNFDLPENVLQPPQFVPQGSDWLQMPALKPQVGKLYPQKANISPPMMAYHRSEDYLPVNNIVPAELALPQKSYPSEILDSDDWQFFESYPPQYQHVAIDPPPSSSDTITLFQYSNLANILH